MASAVDRKSCCCADKYLQNQDEPRLRVHEVSTRPAASRQPRIRQVNSAHRTSTSKATCRSSSRPKLPRVGDERQEKD